MNTIEINSLKIKNNGAGQLAWQLRALVAIAKDQGLITSTRMSVHNHLKTSVSGPSSDVIDTRHVRASDTYMYAKHPYT